MNAVATRVALTQEVVPGLTPCPMPHATADIIGTARRTARTLDAGATRRTVALIDEHEFTRDCIATCLEMLCPDFAVTLYADLDECVMAGPGRFELVIYHSRGRAAAPGSGSAWLTALGQKLGPATPVLIVSDAEDADMMRQALTAGVRGYITTQNTSLQVTVEVLHLLRAGGTFAPVATSLMQQAQPPPEAASLPPDRFTPRQRAVLERLKHGSANKIIAHELSMSEGTVKVHVRNIMKKLHATNRTQAVFRAYELAGAAAGVQA